MGQIAFPENEVTYTHRQKVSLLMSQLEYDDGFHSGKRTGYFNNTRFKVEH